MKELLPPLSSQARSLVPGSFFEHYKGLDYKIIGVARHSETLEELVIYQALYGEFGIWARPLAMFFETVEIDGKKIPRFRPKEG